MKIHKRTLNRWLTDFVSIVGQIHGEHFEVAIGVGKGVLCCPPDVFDLLKNRRVITRNVDRYLFSYQGRFGETFVEVRSDDEEKFGLSLTTKPPKNADTTETK